MSWYRFGGRRVTERERAEEMRAHIELYAEELHARGWPRDAATVKRASSSATRA
jgi:hypothetical protein